MIRNLTPHAIVVRPLGGDVEHVLPADGVVVRVTESIDRLSGRAQITRDGDAVVPLVLTRRGVLEGLPPELPDVILVVSREVAGMAHELALKRGDLWVPFDLVRDAGGRVVACRALAQLELVARKAARARIAAREKADAGDAER